MGVIQLNWFVHAFSTVLSFCRRTTKKKKRKSWQQKTRHRKLLKERLLFWFPYHRWKNPSFISERKFVYFASFARGYNCPMWVTELDIEYNAILFRSVLFLVDLFPVSIALFSFFLRNHHFLMGEWNSFAEYWSDHAVDLEHYYVMISARNHLQIWNATTIQFGSTGFEFSLLTQLKVLPLSKK